MTNTSETYWDVDGVSLQTYCQNVESLSPMWGAPTHRGSDVPVAYARGQRHRDKYADSRHVVLGMWVTDWGPDGGPTSIGPERQFTKNMQDLRSLVWRENAQQVALTKRWKDPATGTVVAATAMAELSGDLAATQVGPYSARLVADMLLSDPIFYGPAETVTLAVGTPVTVTNAGDARTTKILLAFDGILSNPTVTNSTLDPDLLVKVGSAIAAGDTITLDVEEFTAVRESDDANMVGTVTRSGGRQWMALASGANTLTLTASSGTGTATLTYSPAYL